MNDISHNLIKFPLLKVLGRAHINVERRASDSNDEVGFVYFFCDYGRNIIFS
jgi:hypothetical protein